MNVRLIDAINVLLMIIAIVLLSALLLFLTTHEVQIVPAATPTHDGSTMKIRSCRAANVSIDREINLHPGTYMRSASGVNELKSVTVQSNAFCIRVTMNARKGSQTTKRQSSIVVLALAPSRRTTRGHLTNVSGRMDALPIVPLTCPTGEVIELFYLS